MNQQMGTSILGTVLNSAVGSGVGDIASQVAGGYFSFRNLKYSRDNESEADYMGLIFAAMAGYDPAKCCKLLATYGPQRLTAVVQRY